MEPYFVAGVYSLWSQLSAAVFSETDYDNITQAPFFLSLQIIIKFTVLHMVSTLAHESWRKWKNEILKEKTGTIFLDSRTVN